MALCLAVIPATAQQQADYQIVPLPRHITTPAQSGEFLLKDGVSISFPSGEEGMQRNAQLLAECLQEEIGLRQVELARGKKIKQGITLAVTPNAECPEGYTLTVNDQGVHIVGNSDAGVFYAIQTLRQALSKTGGKSARLPYVTIEDAPRFIYRGIMFDVSRHFFSLEYLKKQIEAMSYFKLNRMHLHLTDAAGWRLEIKRYPVLTEVAAWRDGNTYFEWCDHGTKYLHEGDVHAYGGYYTQDQMRDLVAFAAAHHITIVPEIEMPGHSEEVMATFPELSCAGEPYKQGEFCVGNEKCYEWVENVLSEVVQVFPSEYIHIGGDEANKEHWKTCPKCQALMQREGLKDVDELQSYFIKRVEKIVNKLGRQMLGWDEILEGGLSPHATVMSWRGEEGGITTVKAGHHAVMTPGNYLYLDKYQDAPHTQPAAIGGYIPLSQVYSYEPVPDSLSVEEGNLIDGVQGNLWAEYIPTEAHNERMLWPRAMAVAEVGWTERGKKDYPAFKERVLKQLPVLREHGYNAFQLENEVGNRPEYNSPVQHIALHKRVTYNTPYGRKYPANGVATLTDGLQGGWTYTDQRWQGFIGENCLDVVIDLDQVEDIHGIQATFMQTEGAWIFYPTSVEVLISEDGENYRSIYTGGDAVNRSEAYGFKTHAWQGDAKARYIRYKADCGESGGWLFTDEIIIK
ncbi:MAG: family 20 glycosylhydrolase [Bacteroidaceae bacterium]|nr:family 20 glycosylhydrolase [Bacteroidaceae bacterium]